jgi:hypothetical protein
MHCVEQARQQRGHRAKTRQDAIKKYLAALEEFYPPARGNAHVSTRRDDMIIVSVPLPARARERMRLFDHMAEVGTRLLLETDEYIILSSQ